jgi:hypothetical protein
VSQPTPPWARRARFAQEPRKHRGVAVDTLLACACALGAGTATTWAVSPLLHTSPGALVTVTVGGLLVVGLCLGLALVFLACGKES